MTPDFELLRDIAAMIDGIPQHKFALEQWRTPMAGVNVLEEPHPCNSIACVVGFMAMHPDSRFNGGHSPRGHGYRFLMRDLEQKLGIPWGKLGIFASRYAEEAQGMPDKVVFARRVVAFLEQHRQPVSEEYRRNAAKL